MKRMRVVKGKTVAKLMSVLSEKRREGRDEGRKSKEGWGERNLREMERDRGS